jgi:hypothetical protein
MLGTTIGAKLVIDAFRDSGFVDTVPVNVTAGQAAVVQISLPCTPFGVYGTREYVPSTDK